MKRKKQRRMIRRNTIMLNAWRDQGISYLKYLNICTAALHSTVKESRQAKYVKYSAPGYAAQEPDGTGSFQKREKVPEEISKY